ncbi:restriction endonuclease subunit S [Tenacibaculum maritimum]|uniref:restriction endonuclease subunit S n=1 Tax=Tenacibaculum maritimum TaxID=107401 RepID=UPI00388EF86B
MELATKQGFKQTEVGLIPEDWLVISLSEAVEFLDGKRRPIKANERVSGNYPYYGASGIIDYVNDYIFDDELILLGEDGENILSRNLPLAFIIKGKAWVNNHAHVMKPNKFFNINFLTEYLESLDYSLLNSGTAQPKLNKKSCLNIRVIAPPIKEQKAIATALSDMDDLIASLESLIAKKQAIKQGAMQQLLTPPHKGGKRLPGFSGDWVEKNLGEVGDVQMCKRIFSYQTSKTGDIPFYKIGTFGKEPDAFIDWDLYQEFRKKYSFPKKGYLLISASGTIGRTVEYQGEDAYYQDSNIIWIDNDEKLITNKYLGYTLKIIKYNTEGSTIKRLYNSIIKSSTFALPPTLDEQKAIAKILSDMDTELEQLETKKAKYQQLKQGMLQELLTGNTRLV